MYLPYGLLNLKIDGMLRRLTQLQKTPSYNQFFCDFICNVDRTSQGRASPVQMQNV
jgi:hypothetical protein